MKIGTPKEIFKGENRVALTPSSALELIKLGHEVKVIDDLSAPENEDFYYHKDVMSWGSILIVRDAIWQNHLGLKP